MAKWYMITVVGEDQPGMVGKVTQTLFKSGCNLGEASMIRLGGNFTIMMMVKFDGDAAALENLLTEDRQTMHLRVHVDPIQGKLHHHITPDVTITVFSADRAGIVAEATSKLADAGLNIIDLNSDVAGTKDKPIYIMQIDGHATKGIETLEQAVASIKQSGIDINLSTIDTVVG